jgi:uncharacterized protein YabN with tetrapyrrole methylase and pyrophosphatase domain
MEILAKIAKLEQEANEFGFAWSESSQLIEQLISECKEIKEVLEKSHNPNHTKHLQSEIGDLLHAACSLCIFCGFDLEETLEGSVEKFTKRFEKVKEIAKTQGYSNLKGQSFTKLMEMWDRAKEELNN